METPPRAWGRRTDATSTKGIRMKHPHGRGEDIISTTKNSRYQETPPRAWGRLCQVPLVDPPQRNTPTGVGKTILKINWYGLCQKHPHGRGEDSGSVTLTCSYPETPPRAWGRQANNNAARHKHRNTPTGVGKTHTILVNCDAIRKHPHGRGEDRL